MFSALLAVAAAVSMQPTGPDDTIVVTGRRALDEAKALKAVNAVSSSSELQLARFHDPVCPLVVGLSKEEGAQVEAQISDIARQVGARSAAAKCTANLIVMVAGDGKAMFADIRRNRPEWVTGLSHDKVQAIAKQTGPVRAWSVTSIRNEDGMIVTPSADGAGPGTMRVQSASIIRQPTRQQLDGSVIIIEQRALNGRTLGEIAHYSAMRGLAMTRPPAEGQVGTVLSMFASTSAPRAMTSFDLGYLTTLYAGDGRATGVQERSRMARNIASGGR